MTTEGIELSSATKTPPKREHLVFTINGISWREDFMMIDIVRKPGFSDSKNLVRGGVSKWLEIRQLFDDTARIKQTSWKSIWCIQCYSVQHIEWLFYCWRYSLCGLELQERSNWRAKGPDILWYKIGCLYCKPVHTSLFGGQLRMTTKLTYLMAAYYTRNDGFTTNAASF